MMPPSPASIREGPLQAVAFDVGHTLIDERIDAANFVAPVQLMPHVLEVLPHIDLPMAAWSNTGSAREVELRQLLRVAQIEHFFKWVVTSIDAGCRKPNREFFRFALQSCGLSADEVVFVGNQLNTDICGGSQCGIRTVWISGEAHRSPDETMKRGEATPDFEIASLSQLPTLLRRLRRARAEETGKATEGCEP
jgi:FMN phosphatase YigB (HAD superfamily)